MVEQYLAFAETMAQQRTPMYIEDWIQKLDDILKLNARELLTHAGKISHEKALEKSNEEYQKYKATQKIMEKEQSLKEIEEDIRKLKKMDKKLITEIGNIIQSFNQLLQSHLPALEKEIKRLIKIKSVDVKIIEQYLDSLLSLTMFGVGDNLFMQLVKYYKTVDADGAMFYSNEYDKMKAEEE